ncbi:MAG: cadmium-translocating P-type ATPase [Deltaproteobacteria bacterium]|nr:cadmium-translocating P-type ATPase [Deltaproteobacteria bacterium]
MEPVREYDIEGMTCASCVTRLERVLKRVPGVSEASVNLATRRATVTLDRDLDDAALVLAVERAGFDAERRRPLQDKASERSPARSSPELQRAVVALALAAPLGTLAMGPWLQGPWNAWVQGLLATGLVFGAGSSLHRAALGALRHREATMDTLVSLGSTAAWGASVATLASGHAGHHGLYFETAGVLVAFVLLGRWLESRARWKTAEALRALGALLPETATVLRHGVERAIPLAKVRVGDTVKVPPFGRVPVDGVVREGQSAVDESMVTGESMPVPRGAGDPVVAGTLNGGSPLTIDATRVGAETTLSRIVALVERAQGTKGSAQRLADRVSGVFVPAVLLASAVTFLAWWASGHAFTQALSAAVTVLVVACPCALGLATPTALLVGTGLAARSGILVRDAPTLERASAVDTVLFDKTGTLTLGRASVAEVLPEDGCNPLELLSFSAAVERPSAHPLARAVAQRAADDGAPERAAEGVLEVPGQGVEGTVDGRSVVVGQRALALADEGVRARLKAFAQGRTVLAVAWDGVYRGALAVTDPVRPSAAGAVSALRARGVDVWMLTGDQEDSALAVARAVGLAPERVRWRVSPEEKARVVESLRAEGRVVAVVGDGVNDAPALALADVGFAMGRGTDVALAAAPMTLLREDPRGVPEALELSRATLRAIRQNLFWALGYNLLCLPLAALGLLERFGGPMLASAMMALSSVSVVLNALRLGRVKLRPSG